MPRYLQRDLNDPTKYKIETRTNPDRNTVCAIDNDIISLDCCEIFTDEDGTITVLQSECKHADYLNRQARQEYDLRKQK